MSDDTGDILERLERLLLIYERTKDLEIKKAEASARLASEILAQNRKATLDLMLQFSQYINPNMLMPMPKIEDEK